MSDKFQSDSILKEAKKIVKEAVGLNDKEDKPIAVSYLETEKWIAEQIYAQSSELSAHSEQYISKYILYNKSNPESLEYREEILFDGLIYIPINNRLVTERAVLLPTDTEEYGTDKELIADINNFITNHYITK